VGMKDAMATPITEKYVPMLSAPQYHADLPGVPMPDRWRSEDGCHFAHAIYARIVVDLERCNQHDLKSCGVTRLDAAGFAKERTLATMRHNNK
jgi:hypothetical protein